MKDYTELEIEKLQKNLSTIREAGGWSAEEFGKMIGVTRQTIWNLENPNEKNGTKMTKTQYIAIRAVLDYEMAEHPDNKKLIYTVKLFMDSDEISESDAKKAQAFVTGAYKTGLSDKAINEGIAVLLGAATAPIVAAPLIFATAPKWLSKIIKKR